MCNAVHYYYPNIETTPLCKYIKTKKIWQVILYSVNVNRKNVCYRFDKETNRKEHTLSSNFTDTR